MTQSPAQTLTLTRILWAGLLAGQLIFLIVVAALIVDKQQSSLDDATVWPLLAGLLVFLVTAVGVGLFLRAQVYKAHWQGQVVTPHGYLTGNLIFLALCEGVSFAGLALCLAHGSFWPFALGSFLALSAQVVNFPHGGPMHPQP